MNHRRFSLASLIVVLVMTLSIGAGASQAQMPQPAVTPGPGSLAQSAGAASPQVALGQPGTSYRYVQTMGVTGTAYVSDTLHINHPNSLYIDSSDNLFTSEEQGYRVLGFNGLGQNIFIAGKAGNNDTTRTTLLAPSHVSKDSDGYIWVTDYCRIVQLNSNGDFQQSLPAEYNWPSVCGADVYRFTSAVGITFSSNFMFVADLGNHRVLVYTVNGVTSPVYVNTIGVPGEPGSDNYHFYLPTDLAADSQGRLFVSDSGNQRIQRCSTTDSWASWACSTFRSGYGLLDGLFVDSSDNVYFINNPNNHVIKIDSGGNETVVISDLYTWGKDVAADSSGNIYIADWPASTIRKYNASGAFVSIFAGVENVPYLTASPHLNRPYGLTVSQDGSLFIGENLGGYRLVKMDAAGNIVWTAGSPGNWGSDNQHFGNYGGGVEGNPAESIGGQVFVADTANHRIQILNTADGSYVNTIGGYGFGNYQFNEPMGVAINPANGDIFIVDSMNHRIQIYTSSWVYKARIGMTGVSGTDNSHLNHPQGVAVSNDGSVFIADSDNFRVQKCVPSSPHDYTCSTFAGITGESGNDFSHLYPNSVAVDNQGHVFVADRDNRRVQVFDAAGAYLTTVGGLWGDLTGQFRWVAGIALDAQGNLFVADENNHRIQKFAPGAPGWVQTNINGFGSSTTVNVSLEGFNGYLYAGTSDWAKGTQIWRAVDGRTWNPATEPVAVYKAILDMIEFGGKLYVGTGWSGTPASIWQTSSGTDWAPVVTDGFGYPGNQNIDAFGVFNGMLYASVSGTGVSIYRSSTGGVGDWSPVVVGGNGDVLNTIIDDFVEFNGRFYAVGKNEATGAFVWQSSADGISWSQVNPPGFGVAKQMEALSIAVFNGNLYVGTCAKLNCNEEIGQIWTSSNGTTWSPLISDGFGNSNNRDVAAMHVFNGALFAVVENDVTGNQVWKTIDGTNWMQVVNDGWGDSNNIWTLRNHGITTFANRLFNAALNNASGVEIWQMLNPAGYLPLVKK